MFRDSARKFLVALLNRLLDDPDLAEIRPQIGTLKSMLSIENQIVLAPESLTAVDRQRAAKFAQGVTLCKSYGWEQYMADLYKEMIKEEGPERLWWPDKALMVLNEIEGRSNTDRKDDKDE